MKEVIAKSAKAGPKGLVFVNPRYISQFQGSEIVAYQATVIGGGVAIILIVIAVPRIMKYSWNCSKKLSKYSRNYSKKLSAKTLSFTKKRIQSLSKIKKSSKIRSLFKKSSKVLIPFKYVGFIERRLIRIGSNLLFERV